MRLYTDSLLAHEQRFFGEMEHTWSMFLLNHKQLSHLFACVCVCVWLEVGLAFSFKPSASRQTSPTDFLTALLKGLCASAAGAGEVRGEQRTGGTWRHYTTTQRCISVLISHHCGKLAFERDGTTNGSSPSARCAACAEHQLRSRVVK